MTFTIRKRFTFSASHRLEGLEAGHQCGRLHGHNYVIGLELTSEHLNGPGFVVDYGELKPFREFVDSTLDHRHLNDVLPGLEEGVPMNPTAEALAHYLYGVASAMWEQVTAVTVEETATSWAEYRP